MYFVRLVIRCRFKVFIHFLIFCIIYCVLDRSSCTAVIVCLLYCKSHVFFNNSNDNNNNDDNDNNRKKKNRNDNNDDDDDDNNESTGIGHHYSDDIMGATASQINGV